MKKTSLIAAVVVVAIALAGGSFYTGMVYGKGQNSRIGYFGAAGANLQGMRGAKNGANGAALISGSILSKDDSSITMKLPNNGGSKIIFFSDTTQISKFASGTADDLVMGTQVSITGTTNSDGSITAQSIQIRPVDQNGFNR